MAKRNTKTAWIAGAVVGLVAGAAYALWSTPMSGQELRSKLSRGPVNQQDDVVTDKVHTQGVGEKVLDKIEHTLAPIVGVELGKTAESPVVAEAPAPGTPVMPAPATPAEPAAPAATTFTNSESIRAPRFAWGDPAPESVTETVAATATAVAPPIASPEATGTTPIEPAPTTTSQEPWGNRNSHFAWGSPAPESDASANGKSEHSANGKSAAAEPASTVSGSTLRQFPKLGE